MHGGRIILNGISGDRLTDPQDSLKTLQNNRQGR
nr:MAG TPA: hypothetical protein [Caudoviricetes sp.]